MKDIRHILFDNDGTLVDTEILAVQAFIDALAAQGHHFDLAYFCTRFTGHLERDIMAILARDHGVPPPEPSFFEALRDEHHRRFEAELKAIVGMDTVLSQLKPSKSMVSNASARHVTYCLNKTGLGQYIDGPIFSAEQVVRPKPDPDVYLYALEQLGATPHEVIVVEDSIPGVTAAKNAGLVVVGFLGAAHIGDGHAEKLKEQGADYLINDAQALLALFGNMDLLIKT
jgi:HAD superfamily hydrolase (TIGR01509 family)